MYGRTLPSMITWILMGNPEYSFTCFSSIQSEMPDSGDVGRRSAIIDSSFAYDFWAQEPIVKRNEQNLIMAQKLAAVNPNECTKWRQSIVFFMVGHGIGLDALRPERFRFSWRDSRTWEDEEVAGKFSQRERCAAIQSRQKSMVDWPSLVKNGRKSFLFIRFVHFLFRANSLSKTSSSDFSFFFQPSVWFIAAQQSLEPHLPECFTATKDSSRVTRSFHDAKLTKVTDGADRSRVSGWWDAGMKINEVSWSPGMNEWMEGWMESTNSGWQESDVVNRSAAEFVGVSLQLHWRDDHDQDSAREAKERALISSHRRWLIAFFPLLQHQQTSSVRHHHLIIVACPAASQSQQLTHHHDCHHVLRPSSTSPLRKWPSPV